MSVVVPTYNRANLLPATLESIFSQTVPPSEVLLVDDGSPDDTAEVVARFIRNHPEWNHRLYFLRQDNQGKSVALNRALTKVTGDWIAYDDSDDLWRPGKLETQFRALAEAPDCSACFTDAQFVNDPEMNLTAFSRAKKTYQTRFGRIPDAPLFIADAPHGVFMQTVLVRKETMDRVGDFDPRFRVSQDTDFLFRLACETPLCYVNEPLVEIDRTPQRERGLTKEFNRSSLTRLQTLEIILQKWLNLLGDDRDDIRSLIRSRLSDLLNEMANYHLNHMDIDKARRTLFKAIRVQFSVRFCAKYALLLASPSWLGRRRGH